LDGPDECWIEHICDRWWWWVVMDRSGSEPWFEPEPMGTEPWFEARCEPDLKSGSAFGLLFMVPNPFGPVRTDR